MSEYGRSFKATFIILSLLSGLMWKIRVSFSTERIAWKRKMYVQSNILSFAEYIWDWLHTRGRQHGARGHQVAREDHVGRPWACLKNSIKLMSIVT